MSNLRYINTTEISTTVNTVNIENVFTDDFDIYVIEGNDIGMTNGGGDYLYGRVLNSSGSQITSDYVYATAYMPSSSTTMTEEGLTGRTEWESLAFVGDGGNDTIAFTMYIFNPTNANQHTYYYLEASTHRNSSGICYLWRSIGVQQSTQEIKGIQFSAKTGNMDRGKFQIYGLRVDS